MRDTALGRRGKQVAVACAAATLLAGCSASAQTAPAPPTTTAPPSWLLLDADSHGAIMLGFGPGGPDRLRGTSRDGTAAWQADRLAPAMPSVVCAGTCPAAVASAGQAAETPIVPELLGGASLPDFQSEAGKVVLAAPGGDLADEVRHSDGRSELVAGDDHRIETFGRSVWRTASDTKSAYSLSPAADGTWEVRSWSRDTAGWQPTANPVRSSTLFGCADQSGRRFVTAEQRPVLLDTTTGRSRPIADLESGGDCGFGADGVVVAEYSASGISQRTQLVVSGLDGQSRWHSTYPFEARIRTDGGGRNWLALLGDKAEERSFTGELLRTVPEVADARYDETGDIVVISPAGTVRWLPRSS